MTQERDKFLTEAMGECWHDTIISYDPNNVGYDTHWQCSKCKKYLYASGNNHEFSTWQGFGKLWEWAQKQEWWGSFRDGPLFNGGVGQLTGDRMIKLIHPDRFANALYSFLKEQS